MTDEDVALGLARILLDRNICECGHQRADHQEGPRNVWRECDDEFLNCDCQQFEPVSFVVTRADVKARGVTHYRTTRVRYQPSAQVIWSVIPNGDARS